eukprot:SAG11_NODE_10333_length_839_cov_0.885135_1_plen_186_part_01
MAFAVSTVSGDTTRWRRSRLFWRSSGPTTQIVNMNNTLFVGAAERTRRENGGRDWVLDSSCAVTRIFFFVSMSRLFSRPKKVPYSRGPPPTHAPTHPPTYISRSAEPPTALLDLTCPQIPHPQRLRSGLPMKELPSVAKRAITAASCLCPDTKKVLGMHTHTHIPTYIHTYIHTCMHTRMHAYTLS